jgi:uncharacterized protein
MEKPAQDGKALPDPTMNPGDEAYFAAARDGRLLVKHCGSCKKIHHYPRSLCPFCWSDDLTWVAASGRGEIYTYSVMRRGEPYCIAYVRLAEGPTLMTNIVDCDLDAVRIGNAVRVVFKPTESALAIPMFTLDEAGGGS